MADVARGDGPRGPVRGAPPDAITVAEARRRWTRYRAEVWLTLAEVRGQSARAATLRRLRPGSLRFRLAVAIAGPLLALRRRLRGSAATPVRAATFPHGDEPADAPDAPADVGAVVVHVVDGAEARDAVARANEALDGDGWLMVLDAGDRTLDGALAAMAAIGERDGADAVFGDEHSRDEAGRRVTIARPGAAGPVALLSYDVTGRAVLFRRSALRALGGFDASAGWAFRHDAVVRLVEAGARVRGAARAVVETPSTGRSDARAMAAATVSALARRGVAARAHADGSRAGLVRWELVAPPVWPLVSIVIPTRDRLDLLEPCLAALESRTTYPNYEVVIVDNGSVEERTRLFLERTRHRVVAAPGPFNYSRVVNAGVAAAGGELVVTLNNDVTISSTDWLEQMVGVARLPGVGIVGVYLEDPSGHPQHEGVVIAPYPQHLRRDRNYVVPDVFLEATREVAAVTGACQMVRRSVFDELGGLDESLAVVHNDIDFCLRAARLDWRTVYLATVRHLHAESSSRGRLTPQGDVARFVARWDVFGALRDPWFPSRWELVGDVIRWRRPPA
jgi:GT2 family glycosyltransferase